MMVIQDTRTMMKWTIMLILHCLSVDVSLSVLFSNAFIFSVCPMLNRLGIMLNIRPNLPHLP